MKTEDEKEEDSTDCANWVAYRTVGIVGRSARRLLNWASHWRERHALEHKRKLGVLEYSSEIRNHLFDNSISSVF